MSDDKVKHTPGPWERDKSTSSQGHDIYSTGDNAELLASVYPMKRGEYGSWEANADLIAAAPEMLKKLEKVSAWLHQCADQQQQSADQSNQFITIREACLADAKNYRATAKDIETVTRKARGIR